MRVVFKWASGKRCKMNDWVVMEGIQSMTWLFNVTKAINHTSLSAVHLKVWTNSKYLSSESLELLGADVGCHWVRELSSGIWDLAIAPLPMAKNIVIDTTKIQKCSGKSVNKTVLLVRLLILKLQLWPSKKLLNDFYENFFMQSHNLDLMDEDDWLEELNQLTLDWWKKMGWDRNEDWLSSCYSSRKAIKHSLCTQCSARSIIISDLKDDAGIARTPYYHCHQHAQLHSNAQCTFGTLLLDTYCT